MWHILDDAMVSRSYPCWTYTAVAFRDYRTWVFKDCQPAPGMPATCAFNLCDGAAYLCLYARWDLLVMDGDVTSLPGISLLPAMLRTAPSTLPSDSSR